MRAAALLLSLAVLAAGPAGAQQRTPPTPQFQGGRIVVPAAPGPSDGAGRPILDVLRGPDTAQTGAPPVPVAPPTPVLAPLARPAPIDGGQCRLACARSYYFCLASDSADECPSAWGQCRSRCDAPSPISMSAVPAG